MTRQLVWAVVLAGYAACAFAIGPIGVTITDEVRYITEARVLLEGRSLRDGSAYRPDEGRPVPSYPAAWPVTLAPWLALPWPAAFAAPVLLHLIGTLVFSLLLRARGLSSWWALLYFAQPAQLLFSRTLMAEAGASLLTVLLLLAAEKRRSGLAGVLVGLSLLWKPSLAITAISFVSGWLWFQTPREERKRKLTLLMAGAALPTALWVGQLLSGLGGTEGYLYWLRLLPSARHLGMVLMTLGLAWPGLPLGLLRARPAEAVGAAAQIAVLLFYGYDYAGPSFPATIIVGTRLMLPAVVLLLPGYAMLLQGLAAKWRRAAVGALLAAGLGFPIVTMRALAGRRATLEDMRKLALANVRPTCLIGYTPFAIKLLVPYPTDLSLFSIRDEERVRTELAAGRCIDLIAPTRELTTLEGSYADQGFFARLKENVVYCEREGRNGLRITQLASREAPIDCTYPLRRDSF